MSCESGTLYTCDICGTDTFVADRDRDSGILRSWGGNILNDANGWSGLGNFENVCPKCMTALNVAVKRAVAELEGARSHG